MPGPPRGVSVDTIADRIEGSDAAEVATTTDNVDERERTRRRYFGFVFGIVLGFAATAFQVMLHGYHMLPGQLIWGLIWAPGLGLLVGDKLGRPRNAGRWKWRRLQLRTGTLMVVVAYVALLFGMGVSTERLGNQAREYYQKTVTARSVTESYETLARTSEAEASRKRESVKQLLSGKIPDSLLPGQQDFLRSLDADSTISQKDREYRRGLITQGEELVRNQQERSAVFFRNLVEYHKHLAS